MAVYNMVMADPFDESAVPTVVYEDSRILVVRKPCGMHSAPGNEAGDLCSWVFERYPDTAAVRSPKTSAALRPRDEREGGLVHRLDKETSGLVLFARTDSAFAALLRQQEEGRFRKEYRALCSAGGIESPRGSRPAQGVPLPFDPSSWAACRAPGDLEALARLLCSTLVNGAAIIIESSFRPFGPRGSAVACLGFGSGGPTAIGRRGAGLVYRSEILETRVASVKSGGKEHMALELRLGLAKGFRHQLRAHLAWVGLPIIGDPVYGALPARRLFLHAERISFSDPETGFPIVVGPEGLESDAAG